MKQYLIFIGLDVLQHDHLLSLNQKLDLTLYSDVHQFETASVGMKLYSIHFRAAVNAHKEQIINAVEQILLH